MRSSTPRRFTVLDAMVLIAATGIALVPIRLYLWENWHFPENWSASEIMLMGLEANLILIPPALALTLALWLLRLKQPRPRLRHVFRQPGLAACTTTLVFTIANLLSFFIHITINNTFPSFDSDDLLLWMRIGMVPIFLSGGAVAAVWIVLWLSESWRAEPSWIDRAGRVLGVYWVLLSVFFGWIFYAG
jgi:hypothetical protein